MIGIIDTGERIILEKETPAMIARHYCAYKFAEDYIRGKKVLDIGCGEGYGTYYLSEFAKDILGLDYDKAVINYAKDKYQKENLRFEVFDVKKLESFKNSFDVICAFQFIEHLQNHDEFLMNLNNLLNNDGIFICSTPNKLDASPNSATPLNKFHMKEFYFDEFKDLLSRYFKRVEMSGLKRGRQLNFYRRLKKIGFFKFFPNYMNPVKKFYDHIDYSHFEIVKDRLHDSLDFIAVCRK